MKLINNFLLCYVLLTASILLNAADLKPAELNLIKNGTFRPDMDGGMPASWLGLAPGKVIKYLNSGATFSGGPWVMYQYVMGDTCPGYKVTCRIKQKGGIGTTIQVPVWDNSLKRHYKNAIFTVKKIDEWVDVSYICGQINPHNGFTVSIRVPKQVKEVSVENLKVVPFYPDTSRKSVVKIDESPLKGIIISENPSTLMIRAAASLQADIYQISASVIPVYNLSGNNKNIPRKGFLYLGKPAISIAGKGFLKSVGRSGYRIKIQDGYGVICGNDNSGTVAGIVAFSNKIGAVHFSPGVAEYKKTETLRIPVMDISRTPVFEFADGIGNKIIIRDSAWRYGFLPQEIIGSPLSVAPSAGGSWSHAVRFLVPPDKYSASHPEYFAMNKDGKRMGLKDVRNPAYLHICHSNPEVQDVATERIMKLIELQPDRKYFSLAQADGYGWCQCKNCKKMDVKDGLYMDRLLTFANAVAKKVAKKYPDKILLVLAYAKGTEELPLKTKPEKNVGIVFCFWKSSWPVRETTFCQKNNYGLELLKKWSELAPGRVLLFMYPSNIYEVAEKNRLARKLGCKGFYHCGWVRSEFPEITMGLTGQMLWNPDINLDKAARNMMNVLYGKQAAPYMFQYFKMHNGLMLKLSSGRMPGFDYYRQGYRFVKAPESFAKKGLVLLNKAERAAGNNVQRKRIEKLKYQLLFADINTRNPVYVDMDKEQLKKFASKLTEFLQLARKLRIRQVTIKFRKFRMGRWLYQVAGINANRKNLKWENDPAVKEFLHEPMKVLNREVKLQEKMPGGWKLPAGILHGGFFSKNYKGRPTVILRRKGSMMDRAFTNLYLDKLPGEPAKIVLRGMDNDKSETASIGVKINGSELYSGPVKFDKKRWSKFTISVPVKVLRKGKNRIVITNFTKSHREINPNPGPDAAEADANYNWGWLALSSIEYIASEINSTVRKGNLMKNPSAETSGSNSVNKNLPPGWGFYRGSGIAKAGLAELNPDSGKKCVFLRYQGQSVINNKSYVNTALTFGETNGRIGKKAISAAPGKYKVTFKLKGNLPFIIPYVLGWNSVNALPEDRKRIKISVAGKIVPTSDWKEYTGTFTLPASIKKFAVLFSLVAVGKSPELKPGQTIYIDDVKIISL